MTTYYIEAELITGTKVAKAFNWLSDAWAYRRSQDKLIKTMVCYKLDNTGPPPKIMFKIPRDKPKPEPKRPKIGSLVMARVWDEGQDEAQTIVTTVVDVWDNSKLGNVVVVKWVAGENGRWNISASEEDYEKFFDNPNDWGYVMEVLS